MILDSETERWYKEKSFTYDWSSMNFSKWAQLLSSRRESALSILEIGSWEGRSALFFLNYFPQSHIVCIDTFEGGSDHKLKSEFSEIIPGVEARFDANLIEFKDRIEKIKAPSGVALPQLGISSRRFDIAFVDGSHEASDVYSDAVLVWPMIFKGGIMILDDYAWDLSEDELRRPKLGIDAFLASFEGQFMVREKGYQIIIEKI